MKKVSFALVLVIFLFACATSEKYDRKLAGWVGENLCEKDGMTWTRGSRSY